MKSGVADHLVGPILRSVSRSFYLSIRFLPSGLREPVGLAYLLARATDTIADTSEIPADIRKPQLQTLAAAIQGDLAPNHIGDLQTSFVPVQTDSAERKLIESLPECLEMLDNVAGEDRRDIRELLEKINRAQVLDVERFGTPGGIRALSSAVELNEYTYLIAGCVGEFWTQMCGRHVGDFAELPTEQMLELGRRYGEGLQLINILRDAGSDLRAGRCYFPNEELENVGLLPGQILQEPERFMPVFRKWLDQAERGLMAGMEYSLAVRPRRVRGATVLPALIGARTIVMLKNAGGTVLETKVKIPRQEVRSMLRSVAMTLASKATLKRIFSRARPIASAKHAK
jgi:farnesyl-diphosphate farnesyltransferase